MDRSVVAGEAPSAGVVMRDVLRVRGTSARYCAEGVASGSLTVRGRLLTERAGLSDLRPASQQMYGALRMGIARARPCYRCKADHKG